MSEPFEPLPTLLDRKRVASLGLEADEWSDLVDLYSASAAEAVRDMRAAAERADVRRLAALAHKLRGTSANLGFSAMAVFCEAIERPAAPPGDLGPAIWERFTRMLEQSVEEARRS